jgi:hypothetical protein
MTIGRPKGSGKKSATFTSWAVSLIPSEIKAVNDVIKRANKQSEDHISNREALKLSLEAWERAGFPC